MYPRESQGISLGGIVAGVLKGAEPGFDAVSPNAGGAGLTDIGARSRQALLGPGNCANAQKKLDTWRQHHRVKMHNAALGGTLGVVAWALGIDYGPLGIPGGKGTVFEGRISHLQDCPNCFC